VAVEGQCDLCVGLTAGRLLARGAHAHGRRSGAQDGEGVVEVGVGVVGGALVAADEVLEDARGQGGGGTQGAQHGGHVEGACVAGGRLHR
jgi:hypothetical protein